MLQYENIGYKQIKELREQNKNWIRDKKTKFNQPNPLYAEKVNATIRLFCYSSFYATKKKGNNVNRMWIYFKIH